MDHNDTEPHRLPPLRASLSSWSTAHRNGFGKVSNYTMCVHRIAVGLVPAYAKPWLTGAIRFVEDFIGAAATPDGFSDSSLTNPNVDFVLAGT